MAQHHPFGMPLHLVTFSETNEVIVSAENLNIIFDHSKIQDRKVVILSLIGAFRGGKSFFLDYCLRFLYAHFPSINNQDFKKEENWMGSADKPLSGFSWSSGYQRNTTGIIMWSDVFLHTIDGTDEKIAIFVMDTQGLFDNQSTPADNSKIFALGTLVSSIPVFNLMNRIQEDHLEYLQFVTEFAKHTAQNSETIYDKPFQNLMFLVRDWINVNDFRYGIVGGEEYLKVVLKPRQNEGTVIQSVRESISNSFEHIRCCLMPPPGSNVTTDCNYDGNWTAMKNEFKQELQNLIEYVLLPDNLIVKKINGLDVTVKEMKQYFQAYFILFQSNDIPVASTIYELTVKEFMKGVIEKCINEYKITMFRYKDMKANIHEFCKEIALKKFDEEKKMGNEEYKNKCRVDLSEILDKVNEEFEQLTEEERKQLQAALDREEQQRLEADRARRELEELIVVLEDTEKKLKKEKIAKNLISIVAGIGFTAVVGKVVYTSLLQNKLADFAGTEAMKDTGTKIAERAVEGAVNEGTKNTTDALPKAGAKAIEKTITRFAEKLPSFSVEPPVKPRVEPRVEPSPEPDFSTPIYSAIGIIILSGLLAWLGIH